MTKRLTPASGGSSRRLDDRASVVIAGAGFAGIATAWHLGVRQGHTDAVIVDPRPPLTLTSNRSGENYRDWWPQRPMVELVRRSVALMDELRASGGEFAMNRRGYLYVTRDAATAGSLPDLVERYRSAGVGDIRVHRPGDDPAGYDPAAAADGADVLLDPDRIRLANPHLVADVAGAVHARLAGTVDAPALGGCLLELAQERGLRVVRGEVIDVECPGGRVASVAVTTDDGRIRIGTDRFVNAAGPFAGHIAHLLGVELPVDTVLQQRVLLDDARGIVPRNAPFTILIDPQKLDWPADERRRLRRSPRTAYLTGSMPGGLVFRPWGEGGSALMFAWAFNTRPVEPSWDPVTPPEFPRAVVVGATRLMPELRGYLAGPLPIITHDGGLYVRTPDDLPLIGPSGPNGAYVVAGLAGFGVMTACAAGELAAAWITGGSRPGYAASLHPDRFLDAVYLSSATARGEPGARL